MSCKGEAQFARPWQGEVWQSNGVAQNAWRWKSEAGPRKGTAMMSEGVAEMC